MNDQNIVDGGPRQPITADPATTNKDLEGDTQVLGLDAGVAVAGAVERGGERLHTEQGWAWRPMCSLQDWSLHT